MAFYGYGMSKTKALELLDKYSESGKNRLKVVKFRPRTNGGWFFGVFVAYQGRVVEVTNYFAIAHDKLLKDRYGNWETKARPGYDLETWVNEI